MADERIKRRPRALRAPSITADPEMKAKLKTAAASIGVSIDELADMVIDGGLRPPKENLTQQYSLEDLGQRLWSELQTYARPLREEWFEKLTELQQRALIVVLRDRGHASIAIANEFHVPLNQVIRTWNTYCDELGSQITGMRLETIVGRLTAMAERAQQMALDACDHKALWVIAREHIEALQSLGVVDRAIHRVDHHHLHAIDAEKRAELDEMVKLEMKKEKRYEEIKLAEATVVVSDRLPQLTADYDEDESEQEKR